MEYEVPLSLPEEEIEASQEDILGSPDSFDHDHCSAFLPCSTVMNAAVSMNGKIRIFELNKVTIPTGVLCLPARR